MLTQTAHQKRPDTHSDQGVGHRPDRVGEGAHLRGGHGLGEARHGRRKGAQEKATDRGKRESDGHGNAPDIDYVSRGPQEEADQERRAEADRPGADPSQPTQVLLRETIREGRADKGTDRRRGGTDHDVDQAEFCPG